MSASELAVRLRAATRSAHRALDHHPLLQPLTSAALTPQDYAQALAALRAPQAALESCLSGFVHARQFPGRVAALDADLTDLGVAPWPLLAAAPSIDSDAARVGVLYVLEGSRLGGAVIERCLARHLPDAPRRFFGEVADLQRWPAFWRFAEAYCPPERTAEALSAALAAFDCYRRHFDACIQTG